jgi:hypothetical protein
LLSSTAVNGNTTSATSTKKLGDKARKMTMAQQFAAEATDKQEKTWEELIPQKYHQYGKIFSEQALERFPGKRQWNHAINLKPDALTSLDCCVYPHSPREKEKQKKFLETNLCVMPLGLSFLHTFPLYLYSVLSVPPDRFLLDYSDLAAI